MKGVIYARYSPGPNQTEQSIEGQLRDCYEYAKTHDITIVGEYIDRHISGTTDNREQFQAMMADSDKKLFEAILVWKIDRFARNRYDSAIYKTRLKKNGVRVLYAKEAIPDGPEGIILESLLEGMAEYYSAELSQKIKRGNRESVLKGKAIGGSRILGYRIAEDKTFQIDEEEAHIVTKIFTMYDSGITVTEIINKLNAMGLKTSRGGKYNKNSLRTILKNQKYIGIYECSGVRVDGGIPPIVDKLLFLRVQKRLEANRRAPARYKAHMKYLLSGKLYCGHCGAGMVGESGTGKSGEPHYYYICTTKKHQRSACDKQIVRKEWLENLVVNETVKHILQPDKIALISKRCAEISAKENSQNEELKHLQRQLTETEKGINNLVLAIEQGIFSKTTQSRLSELEAAREKLEFEIESCKIQRPTLAEKHIGYMLSQFQRETTDIIEEYNESIIECFVHSVYLYDNKLIVTYNLTDREKDKELFHSVLDLLPDNDDTAAALSSSDIAQPPPPKSKRSNTVQIRSIAVYKSTFGIVLATSECDAGQCNPDYPPTYAAIQKWIEDNHGVKVSKSSVTMVKDKCGALKIDCKAGKGPDSGIIKTTKERLVLEAFRAFGVVCIRPGGSFYRPALLVPWPCTFSPCILKNR